MGYNNEIKLKKAKRKQAFLKLAISGVSGGGKTMGALLIAKGLLNEKYPEATKEEIWDKVAFIDTENGSATLYSDYKKDDIEIGEFFHIDLAPPYTPQRLITAIETCEKAGIEVLVVDSLSAWWEGTGGILEKHNEMSKNKDGYRAWADATPLHKKLINKILQSEMHIISSMRVKMKNAMDKDENTGKTVIRKVGLEIVQRAGVEYEMTTVFDVDSEHYVSCSKYRTSLFDQKVFMITEQTGRDIQKWLNGAHIEDIRVENEPNSAEEVLEFIVDKFKNSEDSLKEKIRDIIKKNKLTDLSVAENNDVDALTLTYKEIKEIV